MIDVTESAKAELKKLLASSVDWPGARLRLMDRGQGRLGLGVDIESENDRVVEYGGDVLLLVEDGLASRLGGLTIDVDAAEEGVELVICEHA